MARSRTTYLGINRSATPNVDPWDADDDHLDLYNKLDAIARGISTRDSNSGNRVIGDDAKAGMLLSAQGDAVRGRVVGVSTDDDAFLIVVSNDGAALTDEFAFGYDNSADTLSFCPGAALVTTGMQMNSTGDVFLRSAQAVTTFQIDNTTTSGDPQVQWALSGTAKFTAGVDDSDVDKLKIEQASSLGGARPELVLAHDAILDTARVSIGTTSLSSALTVWGGNADSWNSGLELQREDGGILQINAHATAGYYKTNAGGMDHVFRNVTDEDAFIIKAEGGALLGTTTIAASGGGKTLLFGDNATDAVPGANIAGIYAKDVGGTVEMFAVGEDGINTQISPHDPKTGEYVLASVNPYTGIQSCGLIEQALKDLSTLTGKQYWVETPLPVEQRLNWNAVQAEHVRRREEEIALWDEMNAKNATLGPRPSPYTPKPAPAYVRAAVEGSP